MKQQILGAAAPAKDCTDPKCPFHGEINVKPELFRGKVVRKDISRSATIEWQRPFFVPKYERFEVRRSRMRTHNPACLNAEVGQEVLVAKTRPLSKTKHHVIIKILSEGSSLPGTPANDRLSAGQHKEKSVAKAAKKTAPSKKNRVGEEE